MDNNAMTANMDNHPELTAFLPAALGESGPVSGGVFLLLDGAQLPELTAWLTKQSQGSDWIGLFGETSPSPLLRASPVLVRVSSHTPHHYIRKLITDTTYRAYAVLISQASLSQLAEHLIRHLFIRDPDGASWGLAFWDAGIIPALVSRTIDPPPPVACPILNDQQIASLLSPIAAWCVRDRTGSPRALLPPATLPDDALETPFVLTQAQMTALGTLHIPDLIAETLRKTIPEHLEGIDPIRLYRSCANAIAHCHAEGVEDMASYCETACTALMADSPFDEPIHDK
jgi:hypothetical protein